MTLVLCPAYNESGSLEEFYGKLRARYDGDALFVDDGSLDGSERILPGLRDHRTFLLRHPVRIGYGAALRDGFETALERHYTKIVTLDVDLQHDPKEIAAFQRMLEGHEVVLGSRYARRPVQPGAPPQRLAINRYTAGLIRELFSITFTDPFCGFRGYRSSFLKKARLAENGYGLGLEILLEMKRTKTPFVEIPVETIYVDHRREFLDGLDDPRLRLLYYLGVMDRKRKEIDG